jgi:short-subunit dehydrogenase
MIRKVVKKYKVMHGKVVAIVGASGGIGSALAYKLAAQNTRLVLVGRNSERLHTLASNISLQSDTQCITVSTDITNPEQVNDLMQRTISQFGQLDVLVNAAGAGILKQWNKLEPLDLDAMVAVNLKGSFYTMQAAGNVMKDQKHGHICNVVGILGKHTMPMAAAYCASKFGVVGFSKCMAEELRRYGIKVTLFYFGGVDTPFWDPVSLKVDRAKMLRPETAADAIVHALSVEPQAVPLEVNLQPDSHVFF